jgi:hypothetical protein
MRRRRADSLSSYALPRLGWHYDPHRRASSVWLTSHLYSRGSKTLRGCSRSCARSSLPVFVVLALFEMRGAFGAIAGAVCRMGADPVDRHLYRLLDERRHAAVASRGPTQKESQRQRGSDLQPVTHHFRSSYSAQTQGFRPGFSLTVLRRIRSGLPPDGARDSRSTAIGPYRAGTAPLPTGPWPRAGSGCESRSWRRPPSSGS